MGLVFGFALRRVHSPSSGLGEIKDEETGENLLEDKVRLLIWFSFWRIFQKKLILRTL